MFQRQHYGELVQLLGMTKGGRMKKVQNDTEVPLDKHRTNEQAMKRS